MTEYQDIADALRREYGHKFTAHGQTRYDFTRHVYVGRAGALLLKADQAERLLREALATAEAALADICDSDREAGDDMAWCERRAARALPAVRAALMPHVGVDPVTTVASHALRGPDGEVVKTALTANV